MNYAYLNWQLSWLRILVQDWNDSRFVAVQAKVVQAFSDLVRNEAVGVLAFLEQLHYYLVNFNIDNVLLLLTNLGNRDHCIFWNRGSQRRYTFRQIGDYLVELRLGSDHLWIVLVQAADNVNRFKQFAPIVLAQINKRLLQNLSRINNGLKLLFLEICHWLIINTDWHRRSACDFTSDRIYLAIIP